MAKRFESDILEEFYTKGIISILKEEIRKKFYDYRENTRLVYLDLSKLTYKVIKDRIDAEKDIDRKELFVKHILELTKKTEDNKEYWDSSSRVWELVQDNFFNMIIVENVQIKKTLDLIHDLFDGKPRKSFLRSILYYLDLDSSKRELVIEYTMKEKFDFFRILGKQANFEFTKEELLEIINRKNFSKKTSTGTFGATDSADIMNRRAIILHQKNVDEKVFMAILDSLSGDSDGLEKFLKTAQRDKVLERWKDIPAIQVFLKLQ